MRDISALFEEEYCPPLDPALLSAILSDFDLSDNAGLATARETLDALKASADEEEATAFDPSGSSGSYAGFEDDEMSEHAESSALRSDGTDLTSLSNGVHSLALDPARNHDTNAMKSLNSQLEGLEVVDDATKALLLREMFPNINDFTIVHTLNKCGGAWNRAIEELLNQEFFVGKEMLDGEDRISAKGIDAFSDDNSTRRGRRKKEKRRHKTPVDDNKKSSSLPVKHDAGGSSPWDTALIDVEFVSSRTNMSSSIISSLYHQHGASLSATITALLNSASLHNRPSSSDPDVQAHVLELGQDFPSISSAHLAGLIHLTHPSTAAAHELAKALTTPKNSPRGGIEVLTRYAPIHIPADDDTSWTRTTPKSSRSGTTTPTTPLDPTALAASYSLAQQRAFAQASAAYRRGKSDHLMAAAAGYYSQLGRDYAAKRVEATAEAADELVDAQSLRGEVDLHYVSVKDAVRIAKQKTEAWWRHGGGRKVMGFDGRVMDEASGPHGLRIVTGVGRHSEGGRAKIGPAVGRMLVQGGWKFVIGEGVFTVTGKNR